jgi:hypothetical protein
MIYCENEFYGKEDGVSHKLGKNPFYSDDLLTFTTVTDVRAVPSKQNHFLG